jgi:hypothetical protein
MLSKRRRSKMKKIILVTLVLGVCGVLHNSVLAQEQLDSRYLITYWRSLTNLAIRSGTVVTVVNQSSDICNVQVEWFLSGQQFSATPAGVSGPLEVSPGGAVHFCSRNLSPNIPGCTGGGVSVPALTGAGGDNQGKAIVSSTAKFPCSLIGVDARVYFTTGVNDTAISAISNSKIVFAGEGNLGD